MNTDVFIRAALNHKQHSNILKFTFHQFTFIHNILKKMHTAYKHENMIPVVKCGGGSLIIWGFPASGPRTSCLFKFVSVSHRT